MGKSDLTNSDIAELLAIESESADSHTKAKALRRASAAAFMWPDEAADLLSQKRSLTELNSVGPYISEIIQRWIDKPPKIEAKSELRRNFLTLTEAQSVLAKNPKWKKSYKGDLQMHTKWSDGSGTIHPRGRVYNYRIGLRADWRKVFDCAAEVGKAVEIDSYPDRQDLDGELLLLAKKAGCKIAIDTDAHHPWQLSFVELGLGAALKAGIQAKNIVNFMDPESLLESIRSIG